MSDDVDFDQSLAHAKQILQKEPRARTEVQIKTLCRVLVKVQFFQKYLENMEVIRSCCKCMTLETLASNDIVFHIDMEGDKFYLILQGRVGVYIRKQPQVEIQDPKKKIDKKDILKGLTKVAELEDGCSFGDLALQTNGFRTATIVCITDCTFGVLQKKDFNQILKNQERLNDIKSMGSFCNHPLVEALKFPERLYIFKNSEIKHYSKSDVVFKEGMPTSHIYIVRSGEFLLSKLHHSDTENEEDNPLTNVSRIFKSRQPKQRIMIKIVGPDEVIGLDQIGKPTHTLELSCYSQYGDLMQIERGIYFQKIQSNQNSRRYAEQLGRVKSFQNEQRSNFISKNLDGYSELLALRSLASSPHEQMQMFVRLKRKKPSDTTSEPQKEKQVFTPILKLSKVSLQNQAKNLKQFKRAFFVSPKKLSERNNSFAEHDLYHFRKPSNVFENILEKRLSEFNASSSKYFPKKVPQTYLSTTTNFKM